MISAIVSVQELTNNWTEAERNSEVRRYKYNGRNLRFTKTTKRTDIPVKDNRWDKSILGSKVENGTYTLQDNKTYLLKKKVVGSGSNLITGGGGGGSSGVTSSTTSA